MNKMGLLLFLLLAVASGPATQERSQRIEVTARRFEFTPSEITVKKGQPAVLLLKSDDVAHGLSVKALHIAAEFKKNSPATVRFEPQQSGDFVGDCAHFCGAGHGRMHLTIHVRD